MQKNRIKEGVNLYTLQDKKFKNFRICIMFHRPLLKEEVTFNSLLAAVMKMQCEKYPTSVETAKAFESLYGADLIARASKYGERQIIKMGIQAASLGALGGKNNFTDAARLLKEIVFHSGVNGEFKEETVETEKKNIADAIMAQKNDKRLYSTLRLQEEMCKDEPYGIHPIGYIDALEGIDAPSLRKHYLKVLNESKVDIIITGNFSEEDATKAAASFAADLMPRKAEEIKTENRYAAGDVKTVTDKMDVLQGKLCMGFRCTSGAKGENYPQTVIYNTIFGGSAISKLFNNVREKLSLCYYVSSNIDMLKEIMIVRSGVEFVNFKKAYDEIMLQQKSMENGDFTDEDIESAKKTVINAYRSKYDSISSLEEYYTMQLLLNEDISIEDMIQNIQAVTKENIVSAARAMKLDTVYYLDRE